MHLPLLFKFKEPVFGNGFIAGVRMTGRALLVECDNETWIHGVAPVGISGGGKDRTAAFQEFRRGWAEVLFDIASEVTSYTEFKSAAEKFLNSQAKTFNSDWEQALASVRSGTCSDSSLRKVNADNSPISFDVCELKEASSKATKNEAEEGLQAAA